MNPEELKQTCPTLAGTIADAVSDQQADRFSDEDASFLKVHGIYQGDDRDARNTGAKKYIFMVRVRIPAGILTAGQYLALDALATRYANDTLRATSRQGLQFHGVPKRNLRPLVQAIHQNLLSTLGACGDVNRNVVAPPAPATNGLAVKVQDYARELALALAPSTPAYRAIWIEGVQPRPDSGFADPLYGKTYLPRKFKIGFAIPPVNDVDIFTHCCGFIAIGDGQDGLLGYNMVAGGGMGRSHGNKATFPRLADTVGFLPAELVVVTAQAALGIHRDFSDRANRKRARLKYVIAERGVDWFRSELEQRTGFKLVEPKPFRFEKHGDAFGWHRQADGRLFCGLFIEGGRIKGDLKTALRAVVEKFQPEIRLTPNSNLILAGISPDDQAEVVRALAGGGEGSPLRRASMACVGLPTCGLAIAEAERYLPRLITQIEGLIDEEIVIRMTGCPNGCARPYTAEIGFVGKSPGLYQIWLGGNEAGTRLNRLYREMVKDADIIAELRPLLIRYKHERQTGERFGDWAARAVEFA
ncbi:MAG: NADPH-dependent assimilatory sulfite reductase hemoprotein subunit [Verrucomicrobia bacterium]|nr:NADPH-dependent assimilatory sulfite reductase hemoprotein subunit [Verrucomicrobiota bacterium]